MTMLERVARALCVADNCNPDEDWRDGGVSFLAIEIEPEKAQRWRLYIAKARAAIEAMREPTNEMVTAGDEAVDDFLHDESATHAWQAMLNAAWKEQP